MQRELVARGGVHYYIINLMTVVWILSRRGLQGRSHSVVASEPFHAFLHTDADDRQISGTTHSCVDTSAHL